MKLLRNPGGRRDLISRETSYLFSTVRLQLPTSIMIIQYMIQLPFVLKRFCLLPPKSLWGNLRKVSLRCILLIPFVLFSANNHLFMLFYKIRKRKKVNTVDDYIRRLHIYLLNKDDILHFKLKCKVSNQHSYVIHNLSEVMICEMTLTCLVIMI